MPYIYLHMWYVCTYMYHISADSTLVAFEGAALSIPAKFAFKVMLLRPSNVFISILGSPVCQILQRISLDTKNNNKAVKVYDSQ